MQQIGGWGAVSSLPMSEPGNVDAELVGEVLRVAQELGGLLEYDGDQDAVLFENGDRVYLGDIREAWGGLLEGERRTWLRSVIGEMRRGFNTVDVQRVVPAVRSRTVVEGARLVGAASGEPVQPIPFRLLTEDLIVVLVEDRPGAMVELTEEMVAEAGVSFDSLYETGREHLRVTSDSASWGVFAGRVFVSLWEDGHDASRLLVPELWADLPLPGNVVAIVPHQNSLIVTGDGDPDALLLAFEMAAMQMGQPSPVSAIPLVQRGDGWVPLELDDTHLASSAWRRLVGLDLVATSNELASRLQKAVGEGVFVANVLTREHELTGELETIAVWSEGVPVLLPRVDLVALRPNGVEQAIFVPWSKVAEVCSDILEPTDYHPPRWKAIGFPDAAQMERLTS